MSNAFRTCGRAFLLIFAVFHALVLPCQAFAQTPAADPSTPPDKVRQFMELMQAPEVRQWMTAQMAQTPAASADPATAGDMTVLSGRLAHLRNHLAILSAGAMQWPSEVENASSLFAAERADAGSLKILLQFLAVLLAGGIVEFLAHQIMKRRTGIETGTLGFQVARRVVPALLFLVATVLPLVFLSWPPIGQNIAIACGVALIAQRSIVAIGRVLVVLLEMHHRHTDDAADFAAARMGIFFWYRRATTFLIYFVFGWAVIQVMQPLGFSLGARFLAAYVLGVGLFVIACEAVWHRPGRAGRRSAAVSWLMTIYFLALWGLWVTGFEWLLWLGIVSFMLPIVLRVASKAVKAFHHAEAGFLVQRPIATVFLDRGVRAIIITLAALWLGHVFGVGADTMAAGETMVDKIARGVIAGVVILLAADLIWHLIKAVIDVKLSTASLDAGLADEERAKRARLQTLLPIFRNILAVVIAVIAVLMVLSGLGIEIAPLIAGAGVVGVAVGFGAQTIVKDVISGMFYLYDDAFRIGEYIESGSHKGVVEAFSLRSVKLRHHRGPLTTVPFGELGAVRNLNRDWTIDKISLNVTYDTDLVKLKKVIKIIGQALLDNPDFGPHIIQTLKMKGVEQFGEFAIEVRLAMMTKPGEQFVIRRTALAMIRTAFTENDIEFAVPTIQVSREHSADVTDMAAARYAQSARPPSEEPAA